MRRHLLFFVTLFFGLGLFAQDDIYDQPEPVKPRVVYSNPDNDQNTASQGDGSYENLDNSYNPDYDYRYRRSLRRMYDPYYVMPSSAYLNMYTYPQFSNFYNPYWGSGFTISIGNTWGNSWGWNNGWNSWDNPYSWSSWNNWYSWNSPYYMNSWNSWNNPWGGWNSWGGGWNNPYWGGGWNSPYYGNNWNSPRWGGGGQRSNYVDVSGRPAYSNAQLPQRNYPRANGRYQNPNNAESTFSGNPSGNQNRGTNVNPTPSQPSNFGNTGGGVFGGGRSGSNSNQNSNSGSNNNSSWGGGGSAPAAPASTPAPSRGSAPRGGRF